ncbi:MAG: flagellar biosynthesis anti-sigma factor FlgM [Candidatus Cellulosilyticum pullistercoris]|uniref:Negative regulator of flagellin synthesis n=1 Tax=Candidatus Cellulosilyticum pullistercoris TaxID=2838521 RepID=A0A9E2NK36_9FIRM|nr:flagellar biosynthesis anti-sigma factor FlgM [Candidatus Cellulosilyticum pullistercoris]
MRIDAINRIYDAYKAQSTTASKKLDKTSKKDEVEFSSRAKDFTNMTKLLSDVPDVRTDKVEEIKNRMSSGNYNVKAEEVAEKILSQFDVRG